MKSYTKKKYKRAPDAFNATPNWIILEEILSRHISKSSMWRGLKVERGSYVEWTSFYSPCSKPARSKVLGW